MCLQQVDKVYDGTSMTIKKGYKVFTLNANDNLMFQFQCYGWTRIVPTGEWLVAKSLDKRVYNYSPGFHIFTSRKAAKDWGGGYPSKPIVQVKYRGVLAEGYQKGYYQKDCKVVVAREMFVPKRRTRKGRA